ncbi:MAG: AraC family transcriptional regulator [Roseiarcus sp.]
MTQISTAACAPRDRSRHWHETIASTYFPLDLTFSDADRFAGELNLWRLGEVSLSRLTSQPLQYRRLLHHFKAEREEHFLVTVPVQSEVFFSQCGKDVRCRPGGLILERSHEPYVFSHDHPADLWVVKVAGSALGGRIRQPDRFCSMQFDASSGSGGLFCDMLELIPRRIDHMSSELRATVGRQLVDLLVLALKDDERTLTAGNSAVRAGHLARIESFIRSRIGDPDLDPEKIARACRISTRYLHELFRDTNQTLGSWIRDQRLEACREALADPAQRQTVAEIAYQGGFGDQAQFSRAFKAQYGVPPREYREQALQRRATGE